MLKKTIIIFFIIMIFPGTVQATNQLIESQLDALNLSSFIEEGEKYTKDIFEDVDIEELLKSAISGKINTKTLYSSILCLLGDEIVSSITIIGGILAIIAVHAILKNIGENIGNNSISQVAYYVEYILIVTLVMTSFTNVIDMVKTTITNLVGYINILIPLLLALVMTTGTTITASALQPVILGIIVFIGNGITLYVLPILLISTVLGIVSNLSDKIQIGKLSKMLKSSIVWVLGFVLTMFVSILSLEGTLTSSVDGLTIKGLKTASSTFIPVVGKVLGDSVDTVLRRDFSYKKCSRNSWNNSSNRNMCNSNY
ncbi:MAG: stage III sporulation protein AE [Clostridia bacterium]|nr:stage III sporulation protein AE [Clostridia bacterium]